MRLADPVSSLDGIGPSYSKRLQKLGIHTVADLIDHFPVSYLDTSNLTTISNLSETTIKTVRAKLLEIKNVRLRNGKFIQIGRIRDGDAEIEAIWFNQTFLPRVLKTGAVYLFSGKIKCKGNKASLQAPKFELVSTEATEIFNGPATAVNPANRESDLPENTIHLGRITPQYPLTKGIGQNWLRTKIYQLVQKLENISDLSDILPEEIKSSYQLISVCEAYRHIHFPDDKEQLSAARKRLSVDELTRLQIKLLKMKARRISMQAPTVNVTTTILDNLRKNLPFKLTESQEKTIKEIHHDLSAGIPMQRIIHGDVGSGKTIVAIFAIAPVIAAGYQAIFMAPTAVLAKQHYDSLAKYFPEKDIALITADELPQSQKGKAEYLQRKILIGTHAILYNRELLSPRRGLVIIDEQHRFGVKQREQLLRQNPDSRPHLLELTATPIPRSIALSFFGNYEVSEIASRKESENVRTFIISDKKRTDAYAWLNKKLLEGSQVFWVFPTIEQSELMQLESLETQAPDIINRFKEFNAAIVHSRIDEQAKQKALQDFRSGKIKLLLATTVIEVGIDIPSADIILIENADRYGLAQLHQLRGRVGRNHQEAWCYLFYSGSNEDVINRLQYFTKTNEGNKIAEYDLERRGPGEVYGTAQSGLPPLKLANFTNLNLMTAARKAAAQILKLT